MQDVIADEGRFRVPADLKHEDFKDAGFSVVDYKFPGPVSEAFFLDRSVVSFIQGPYGSGKTTVAFFKLLARAQRMPICRDGIRRYRALVLRDTYRRMERTAIRSWHKWFPPSVGHWTGGQDRPSRHVIQMEDLDGVPLEFEVEFAAVGDADVEDFMGGYEITDLFMNEANLQSADALTYGAGRCGRYPALKDLPAGAKFDYGVIGDLNAPDPDSWLLKLQFGDLDAEFEELGKTSFFLQPGGRDHNAENISNLPEHYYARLAAANKHQPWWVSRMIDNKSGYSRHGKPVYEDYADHRHATREPIPIDRSLPLHFGFDAGLHPAGVVGQQFPNGQIRVIKEFVPGWMGPTRFAELVKQWLDTEARGCRIGEAYADPTAFDGADKEGGELTWVETVEKICEIHIDPAPSNEPGVRIDAVAQLLVHTIDGDAPAYLVGSDCLELRKGYSSHYRFVKVKTDLGEGYAYKPQKNAASHPHDANQYLVLGLRGVEAVISRRTGTASRSKISPATKINTGFKLFKGAR